MFTDLLIWVPYDNDDSETVNVSKKDDAVFYGKDIFEENKVTCKKSKARK